MKNIIVMNMDQKGQISVEFVLIIALMLVLTLIFAGYIGEANESNSVSAAARSGATDAISNSVFINRNVEPFRVNSVQILGSGYDLTVQIDVNNLPSNTTAILNGALNSVAALGYTKVGNTVVSSRHRYSFTVV